jgi:hypothetical protein
MAMLSSVLNTEISISVSIQIIKALDNNNLKTDKDTFFNSQVFDAYVFINEIIKKAQHHIILIDNYIDETVLIQLS